MRCAGHSDRAGNMPLRPTAGERFLWLVLSAAVVIGAFAMLRGHRADAISNTEQENSGPASPLLVTDSDGTFGHNGENAGLLTAERDSPQGASDQLQCNVFTTLPVQTAADNGTGVEMPFEVAVDRSAKAGKDGNRLPHDPAELCVLLRDAIATGSGAGVAALRDRLLALGPPAVPALSALLHDGAEEVELEAFRLLIQIGNKDGLALVLAKILSMPDEAAAYPRMLAAFANNRSALLADWLTDALGLAKDAPTRNRLLDLLYAMRGPETAEALAWAALNPADDLHARDILDCLALRRDPSETVVLAEAMESDTEALRLAAANGLADIGSGDACRILADAAESRAGGPIVASLGSVSSAYAQETLIELALDNGRSTAVRVAAVQSLSGHAGYRVRTVLENAAVQERDSAVAAAMQTALTTLYNAEARNHSPVTGSECGELCF